MEIKVGNKENNLKNKALLGAIVFISGLSLMYLGKGWFSAYWLFLIVPLMLVGGFSVAKYYGYLLKQDPKYK